MTSNKHPKFQYKSADNALYLNFGEYKHVGLACFSGDGSKLLTVREVGIASIWDSRSGVLIKEICPTSPLDGKEGASPFGSKFILFIEAVALNNDGTLALLGLNDGTACIYSIPEGVFLATFYPPDTQPAENWSVIRAVNFSPDGSLILVGFSQRSVGVWRTQDNTLVQFLTNRHFDRLFGRPSVRDTLTSTVTASEDNQYLFAGFADMTATVWRIENKEELFNAYQHIESIIGLWANNNQVRWATTGGNLWAGNSSQDIINLLATDENWVEAIFSPNGQEFLVITSDGLIKHLSEHGQLETISQVSLHFSDRAKTIGFGHKTDMILFVEGENQLILKTPQKVIQIKRDNKIGGFVLSPQENILATYGHAYKKSGSVELWDSLTGKCLHVLNHKEDVSTVTFSNDGKFLVTGVFGDGGGGAIRPISLWDVYTGTFLCELNGHNHQVHALAFSPDGNWLVSASLDRTVRVWHIDHNTPSNSYEITHLRYEDLEFDKLVVLSRFC